LDYLRSLAWFLLPPEGLFWIIGIAGVILVRWRRTGMVLMSSASALLVVFSLPVTADLLLLQTRQPTDTFTGLNGVSAAVVVLSGDVQRTGPEYGLALPGPLTMERLRWGADVHRQSGLPILLSGGRIDPQDSPLAEIMGESLARDFRVPDYWIENQSRNTAENAAFSAKILRARGISTAVVVTHAWHMRRAAAAFQHAGIGVIRAPVPGLKSPQGIDMLIPTTGALRMSSFGMHELIGAVFYQLLGYPVW
jgi:uncharacterized SAM-binding protein YcdF (DUF218 family)